MRAKAWDKKIEDVWKLEQFNREASGGGSLLNRCGDRIKCRGNTSLRLLFGVHKTYQVKSRDRGNQR